MGPIILGLLFFTWYPCPHPTPQTHTHTQKQTYRPIHLLVCLACTLLSHFLGAVKGLPRLLGFSASAAALQSLEPGCLWTRCCSILRAADTHAAHLKGQSSVWPPGDADQTGRLGQWWVLGTEGGERTAAACPWTFCSGSTKHVESPQKLRTPCSETGLLRLCWLDAISQLARLTPGPNLLPSQFAV